MHVAESPHLQVAHGDAREAIRLGPVVASQQLADDVKAIHVVVHAEEAVECKQLAGDVDDEEYLREQVEPDEVVAVASTIRDAKGPREGVLHAHRESGLVLCLRANRVQIPDETTVDVSSHYTYHGVVAYVLTGLTLNG